MSFSPIPRGVYPSITHISPKALAEKGVKLVLADLDNTLVPYKVTVPPNDVIAWKESLAAAGITLFLLSNSRKPGRAQKFAEQQFCGKAGHPLSGPLRQAQEGGLSPGHGTDGGDA